MRQCALLVVWACAASLYGSGVQGQDNGVQIARPRVALGSDPAKQAALGLPIGQDKVNPVRVPPAGDDTRLLRLHDAERTISATEQERRHPIIIVVHMGETKQADSRIRHPEGKVNRLRGQALEPQPAWTAQDRLKSLASQPERGLYRPNNVLPE